MVNRKHLLKMKQEKYYMKVLEFQNIAVFSAEKTRDPHFLDSNTFTGKLFIFGLQFIFNNKNYKSINDITELYFKAGILKDEISNHCTIFSLKVFDYNNKEILPIKIYLLNGKNL